MTRSTVGAYWGPRADSLESSAQRLAQLIEALADIDSLLAGWRDKGKTKAQALKAPLVEATESAIARRLLAGRNRRDDNGQVIDTLGSSVAWWNGSENTRTAVNLSIGMAGSSPTSSNRVVFSLPDSKVVPSLYSETTALRLLETLIDIFEPDSAVWTSNTLTDAQREPDRPLEDGGYIAGQLIGRPAGWATYLSIGNSQSFNGAALPASASRTERLSGTLVTIGDDPADPPLRDVLAVRASMGYDVNVDDEAGAGSATGTTGSGRAPVNQVKKDTSLPQPTRLRDVDTDE